MDPPNPSKGKPPEDDPSEVQEAMALFNPADLGTQPTASSDGRTAFNPNVEPEPKSEPKSRKKKRKPKKPRPKTPSGTNTNNSTSKSSNSEATKNSSGTERFKTYYLKASKLLSRSPQSQALAYHDIFKVSSMQ